MDERILKIKEAIIKMGYNYDYVAEKSGVSKSSVTKIMCGLIKNPGFETLKKLEDVVGIREYKEQPKYSPEEVKLIEMYRKCTDTWKKTVNQVAKAGADDSEELGDFTKANFKKITLT